MRHVDRRGMEKLREMARVGVDSQERLRARMSMKRDARVGWRPVWVGWLERFQAKFIKSAVALILIDSRLLIARVSGPFRSIV